MVGDVAVLVVIIVLVKTSSRFKNGLLLIEVVVVEVTTSLSLLFSRCKLSILVFIPLSGVKKVSIKLVMEAGTLIFSTTPPLFSEKCVTVTLPSILFLSTTLLELGDAKVDKLQTFGVVGEAKLFVLLFDAPVRFKVNLSPPYIIFRAIFDKQTNKNVCVQEK